MARPQRAAPLALHPGGHHVKKAFLFAAVLALLCGCGAAGSSGGTGLPRLVIDSDTYEPFTYPSPDGSMAGIDVELATEACRRMGCEPEFRQIVWENKDDYLDSGEVDCLWGCFTMSGREALYQWAGPYLYSRQAVAVRRDSGIDSLAQLDGLRVAVQASSKPESLLLQGGDGVPDVGAVYCFSTMEEI